MADQTITYNAANGCITVVPEDAPVSRNASFQLSVPAGMQIVWDGDAAQMYLGDKSASAAGGTNKILTWPMPPATQLPNGTYTYSVCASVGGEEVPQCGPPEKPSMTVGA
jgi:hypothetical protein